jgi:GT2 family glycosyltransferase/tetratricopeptide (TPR) repeat protein
MQLPKPLRGLKRALFDRRVRRTPPDPIQEARRDTRVRAENARDAGDWTQAAHFYALTLQDDVSDVSNRVQYAHALKECGRLVEAEAAYRQAIALRRDLPETYLHLGHALKLQGRDEDAKDAYADALKWNPDFRAARDELIAMGARGRLPHHAFGRDAVTERLGELSHLLRVVREVAQETKAVSVFPVQAWNAFKQAHPLTAPPPSEGAAPGLRLLIEARSAAPSAVRATLNSLLDQSVVDWTAVVLADEDVCAHPVASAAARDRRITFVTKPGDDLSGRAAVLLDAGTVLETHALAWLGHALLETGRAAVYADHDHQLRHWRTGVVRFDPVLQAAPDRDDLETTPVPPAVVALSAATPIPARIDAEGRRATLLAALSNGGAAHLPRVIASNWVDEPAADLPGESHAPAPAAGPAPLSGRILVVVPTRDEAALLQTCVESLKRSAAAPELIDILVLDNRSREPETAEVLASFQASGLARPRLMDEPFNWSRFNNLAVAANDAAIVVFANNDVEALTTGWDDRLRDDLARPEIGVVGVRLLYPDGTLQHAGVALGGVEGRPVHEGLHSAPGEGGPLGRWLRRRSVSSVTGAFMAMRREVFDSLGGFDENLAIGYNDTDLCLRARAAGLRILYDPAIALTHHESRTRGLNQHGERVRWDDAELTDFHARWRQAQFLDMSRNPQWVMAQSRVFDGFRDLGPRETAQWLRRSARPDPWRILPEDHTTED